MVAVVCVSAEVMGAGSGRGRERWWWRGRRRRERGRGGEEGGGWRGRGEGGGWKEREEGEGRGGEGAERWRGRWGAAGRGGAKEEGGWRGREGEGEGGGGTYVHSPVARTFFLCTHTLCANFTHLHVCHIHTWLKCHEKGVCRMSVFVLYLAFSFLMSHPSLLFLHGHFETTPDYDFTDSDIHMILPYFPILEAQDKRNSAPASRSLATWPSQMQAQVMSPKSSTRSLLWMMTRCSSKIRSIISLTSRKIPTRTKDCSMFSQCLNPLFRTFLMMILLFR